MNHPRQKHNFLSLLRSYWALLTSGLRLSACLPGSVAYTSILYVSLSDSDTASGIGAPPWRTIQKAKL
jgi:hypothetical protein